MSNSECVCLSYGKVKGRAKKYQYWQSALYKKHKSRNGKLLWRYVSHLGKARRSERLAKLDGIEYSKELKCEFKNEKIRNWYPV